MYQIGGEFKQSTLRYWSTRTGQAGYARNLADAVAKLGSNPTQAQIDAEKAKLLYEMLDGTKTLKPFVSNPKDRSQTTIVIDTPAGNSKEYRDKLAAEGIIVGSGYKEYKEKQIRIGNFPMHTLKDIEKIVKLLQ